MRLVIDLQACQGRPLPHALEWIKHLIASPNRYDVRIVLANRLDGRIEEFRHTFSPLLPSDRIVVFDALQGQAQTPWRLRAAQAIRTNFLATLHPDIVLVPHPFASTDTIYPERTGTAPFKTILALSDIDQLQEPAATSREATQEYLRQGDALATATTVFLSSDALRSHNSLKNIPVQVVDFSDAKQLSSALEAALNSPPLPIQNTARPRLAYISPLPPEKTGIADYSAELIPELARFYDVELITDQAEVNDASLTQSFPIRQLPWFEQHAGEYDRILYHFGNSAAHRHMFATIRRHPGIVVLHDFYLSGVLYNMERDGYLSHPFLQELYDSHGYTGLLDQHKNGLNSAVWKYPINKTVLDHATGVIVHSQYPKQLANQWYGPGASNDWQTIPLLRGKSPSGTSSEARKSLGLNPDDFVICSFGMLGCIKLNDLLLDAFLASTLATNPRCKLVFVGENDPSDYGRNLLRAINNRRIAAHVSITGFVSAERYAVWLQASDIAVQLRSQTRGETSASILDCLLHGIPTIINAHGSGAEIAEDVVVKLPDTFSRKKLSETLERLHGDQALRKQLSSRATDYVRTSHSPSHVGDRYFAAIEQFAGNAIHKHYRTLMSVISSLGTTQKPSESDLLAAATAIAANQPPTAPRQLLVDISALVQKDLKTGIQRVVRSVLLSLIESPPPGFRIEPVFSLGANRGYRYARSYTLNTLGEQALDVEDAPVDYRRGDVLLGIDLFISGTAQNRPLLQSLREHGVDIYFVVYDILPMLRPDVFPAGTEDDFRAYLSTIGQVAKGLVCISRAVADELTVWLEQHPPQRLQPLNIGYFHLGADIDASAPSYGLPADFTQVTNAVSARPSFLMVGTIEPRKGYAQTLDAFDLLWQQGVDVNLVIVGKEGWLVDRLVQRLQTHLERGKRLFWMSGVSDETLLQLYRKASALIAASEGEGFGLPLIEAAQNSIPIIARNLPVFREVAGTHAHYFDGLAAPDLSEAISAWLLLSSQGKAPLSTGIPWLTWHQSTQQLLDAIEGQRWYRELKFHTSTAG